MTFNRVMTNMRKALRSMERPSTI